MRDDEANLVRHLALDAYLGDYPWIDGDYEHEIGDVAGRATIEQVWVGVDTQVGIDQHPGAEGANIVATVTLPHPGQTVTRFATAEDTDLRLLAVGQHARGRGIGEWMMRQVITEAVRRGSKRVMLHTGPEMRGAIRLYERIGFVRLTELDLEVQLPEGRSFTLLTYAFDLQTQ